MYNNFKIFVRLRVMSSRDAHSVAQTSWSTVRDESREMMALWPDIVRSLTDAGRHLDVPDATKRLAKVLRSFFSLINEIFFIN